MLGKLMKYESRACFRSAAPFYIAVIAAAVLMRIFLVLPDSGVFDAGRVITTMLYIGLIVAVLLVTLGITIDRFHKKLLGDEGYLMFTLPATPGQHIASKALVALALDLVSLFVIFVSILVLAMNADVIEMLKRGIEEILRSGVTVVHILEFILLMVLASLSSTLFIYLCIAIGHTAQRHRVGTAIVAFFVLQIILQLLSNLASTLADKLGFFDWFYQLQGAASVHVLLLGSSLLSLLGIAVYYALTNMILTRKLNLE